MNATQIKAAQTVTSTFWIEQKLGVEWTDVMFSKSYEDEDCVLLFGSNLITKHWLDKLRCVTLRIGKRGGVKVVRKRGR